MKKGGKNHQLFKLAICALLCTGFIRTQVTLPAEGEGQPYGMGIPSGNSFWAAVDSNTYPQLANLLAEAGVQWVRVTASWSRFEPEPGKWDEESATKFRTLLAALHHSGLKVNCVLGSPPIWAGLPPRRGPWVAFVQEMVKRYDVDAWEILNEPSRWKAYTDNKESYVWLVKRARSIIRSNDKRDLVILAGLRPPPKKETWKSEAIKYWLKYAGPIVDALNIHSYGDEATVASEIQQFKRWAIKTGVGNKPIWQTEINIRKATQKCPRGDFRCMNPPDGPKRLQGLHRIALNSGIQKVFWFRALTCSRGPGILAFLAEDKNYVKNKRVYSAYQSVASGGVTPDCCPLIELGQH